MIGPKANSEFCFPETLNVSQGEACVVCDWSKAFHNNQIYTSIKNKSTYLKMRQMVVQHHSSISDAFLCSNEQEWNFFLKKEKKNISFHVNPDDFRAHHRTSEVFPRLPPIACFHALVTRFMFSHARHSLHAARKKDILATGCMFYHLRSISRVLLLDCFVRILQFLLIGWNWLKDSHCKISLMRRCSDGAETLP